MRRFLVGIIAGLLFVCALMPAAAVAGEHPCDIVEHPLPDDLEFCPANAPFDFVNGRAVQHGKAGRNWKVTWDRLEWYEGYEGYDWLDRVVGVQISMSYINMADYDDCGRIYLPALRFGDFEKGRHKLLDMNSPGFIKHTVPRHYSKKVYHIMHPYQALCEKP